MADNKYKVLVVEDDPSLGVMYKTKFDADGYETILAVNGAEGVEAAKKNKPDIILLDVIMPLMDGFSALIEIKKDPKIKNIPVVLLTNLGTDEDKAKGEKLGAVDYVVKSNFTPSQVSEMIKKYLN